MGEVPAKDSLTSMCVLKQGDEEKEGEWEEEIRGGKREMGRQNRRECSDSCCSAGTGLEAETVLWPFFFWKDSRACSAGLL